MENMKHQLFEIIYYDFSQVIKDISKQIPRLILKSMPHIAKASEGWLSENTEKWNQDRRKYWMYGNQYHQDYLVEQSEIINHVKSDFDIDVTNPLYESLYSRSIIRFSDGVVKGVQDIMERLNMAGKPEYRSLDAQAKADVIKLLNGCLGDYEKDLQLSIVLFVISNTEQELSRMNLADLVMDNRKVNPDLGENHWLVQSIATKTESDLQIFISEMSRVLAGQVYADMFVCGKLHIWKKLGLQQKGIKCNLIFLPGKVVYAVEQGYVPLDHWYTGDVYGFEISQIDAIADKNVYRHPVLTLGGFFDLETNTEVILNSWEVYKKQDKLKEVLSYSLA